MRKIVVDGQPRLCLFAKKDITEGTEIRDDYGEPSAVLPWRKEVHHFRFVFYHKLNKNKCSVRFIDTKDCMFNIDQIY